MAMSYTLPFEPYLSNLVSHYRITLKLQPSTSPLEFYQMVYHEHGAYAVEVGIFRSSEWEFETEAERTAFILKFG